MLFTEEQNAKVLGSFLQKAAASHIEDESRAKRLKLSSEILGYIYKNPEGWDERCTFNLKHIGNHFLDSLRAFDASKNSHIDDIYAMSYRFLCEFDFLVGSGKELSMELSDIKRKIENDANEMEENVRSQIIYASFVMPASITKDFINDSKIGDFKEFNQKKEEAQKLKEQWDKELIEKKNEIESLKQSLEKYQNAFNFVGLYKGFADLNLTKNKERFWLFISLLLMGLLIVAPLATKTILTYLDIYNGETFNVDKLYAFLPLLSVEIILIYFFRIILVNYKSVKAQIMQIELRQTLCQFIQSYAEYSEKIKKQDSSALEKFESLIFSGILSDPEKLPSTFDGLDQLGAFIKNIKST